MGKGTRRLRYHSQSLLGAWMQGSTQCEQASLKSAVVRPQAPRQIDLIRRSLDGEVGNRHGLCNSGCFPTPCSQTDHDMSLYEITMLHIVNDEILKYNIHGTPLSLLGW